MKFIILIALTLTQLCTLNAKSFKLPQKHQQAIVATPENWSSSHATLQIYEKVKGKWLKKGNSWKTRIGRNGSAWGLGISPNQQGNQKREGDGRSPAGVFLIGGAYGYANSIKKHPSLPYKKVTSRDMWVEDINSSKYNRHFVLKHEPKTEWEKKQQMRQGDYAHALKLYIAHNHATKWKRAKKAKGSAIFFHIWRKGGSKATSGCTVMEKSKLKKLVAQIDPSKNPVYILLPKKEYTRLKPLWKLP